MDESALQTSLTELRQQEEAVKGFLALNPENDQLQSLYAQITEALQMTEGALLALKQSQLLHSLEEVLPTPPARTLPPVGAAVLARFAETGQHYPARVDAHISPTVVRLSWMFVSRSVAAHHFYTTASTILPFVEHDKGRLVDGAACLVRCTPGAEEPWCRAHIIARGGDDE